MAFSQKNHGADNYGREEAWQAGRYTQQYTKQAALMQTKTQNNTQYLTASTTRGRRFTNLDGRRRGRNSEEEVATPMKKKTPQSTVERPQEKRRQYGNEATKKKSQKKKLLSEEEEEAFSRGRR